MRRLARRAAIAAAVILGLGLSGVMCQRVSARGRYVAAYSTYGSGPEGTRGLYLLAEQLGARPQRWPARGGPQRRVAANPTPPHCVPPSQA